MNQLLLAYIILAALGTIIFDIAMRGKP